MKISIDICLSSCIYWYTNKTRLDNITGKAIMLHVLSPITIGCYRLVRTKNNKLYLENTVEGKFILLFEE